MGYGMHSYDVPVENWKYLGILGAITGTTSVLHVLFSKVSFAVTLLRLTDGWLRQLIWFIIITLTLGQMSSSFMFWLRCTPAEATWNPHIKEKKCWDSNAFLTYSIAGGSEYLTQKRHSTQSFTDHHWPILSSLLGLV